MGLFLEALEGEIAELDANGIRLRFVGDLAKLAPELTEAVWNAERRTAANHGMQLVVAVGYGGRWDLVQAARRLAREVKSGRLSPEAIDEAAIAGALETRSLPEVDLLIRTGGEKRISNFLLWDIAYSELCFSDVLWPDFDEAELHRAFEFYAQRQRRFGQTAEQLGATHC
jgi:undecaprenyl diphosphate synthase